MKYKKKTFFFLKEMNKSYLLEKMSPEGIAVPGRWKGMYFGRRGFELVQNQFTGAHRNIHTPTFDSKFCKKKKKTDDDDDDHVDYDDDDDDDNISKESVYALSRNVQSVCCKLSCYIALVSNHNNIKPEVLKR